MGRIRPLLLGWACARGHFKVAGRCATGRLPFLASQGQQYKDAVTARWYSTGLPHHAVILMPSLTPTMDHGNIARWLKAKGDKVEVGDAICQIETEKFLLDFESDKEGYMARILAPEGSMHVQVGQPIAVTVECHEDINGIPAGTSFGLYTRISPAAKVLIKQHGLNLNTLRASGPRGTLLKGDVLSVLKSVSSSTSTMDKTMDVLKDFLEKNSDMGNSLKRNAEATDGIQNLLKKMVGQEVSSPPAANEGDPWEIAKLAVDEVKKHLSGNYSVLVVETAVNTLSNVHLRRIGEQIEWTAWVKRMKLMARDRKEKMRMALLRVWHTAAFKYSLRFFLLVAFCAGGALIYIQVGGTF